MHLLQNVENAALVLEQTPKRSGPFTIRTPSEPTCSSALVHPWELGSWTDTAINPFDDINLLGREISDLRWCGIKGEDLQGNPTMGVVECSSCPVGYKVAFNDKGPLMCRDKPVPDAKTGACTQCSQTVLQPWVVGTCDACISYGVNPQNGNCVCNAF
jgi:hypothetical protein